MQKPFLNKYILYWEQGWQSGEVFSPGSQVFLPPQKPISPIPIYSFNIKGVQQFCSQLSWFDMHGSHRWQCLHKCITRDLVSLTFFQLYLMFYADKLF